MKFPISKTNGHFVIISLISKDLPGFFYGNYITTVAREENWHERLNSFADENRKEVHKSSILVK